MTQVKCQGPQGCFPTGIYDMFPWVNWTGCVIRMGGIGRPKSGLGKWGGMWHVQEGTTALKSH